MFSHPVFSNKNQKHGLPGRGLLHLSAHLWDLDFVSLGCQTSGAAPANKAPKNPLPHLGGLITKNKVLSWTSLLSIEAIVLQHHLHWAGHVSRMCPIRLPCKTCLENLPAARGYVKVQNNTSRISWRHLWYRPTLILRLEKLLLQMGLPGVGLYKGGPRHLSPMFNMKICDMPNMPSYVHHPHFPVTLAHVSSGVDWAFTAISATATRREKGNKERGWRSWCLNASGCQLWLLFD